MKPSRTPRFNLYAFLNSGGLGKKIVQYRNKQALFAQGDPATKVFYIQKGRIKLTVVSKNAREAVVAILSDGDFLGESCLAGQPLRMASATAISPSSVLEIRKAAMMRVLRDEQVFTERFIAHILARNIRFEADLVDQLFNSSEKRLARTLLLLARYGKEGRPETIVPKISQETLAEMVGTTRSRVSFFMNKFRKLGFIDYNGVLSVHSSLLNIVLVDEPREVSRRMAAPGNVQY
jgi:CRP/FNR family transcriptional regulator, cyclic AMP receptor protein